jgi:thiamine kinase-like enzyme
MTDFLIPQEKSAAVTHGLREAFGVTAFEDICMMTKGLTSSLVFRILVGESPFLLKIITRPYTVNSLTRQFASMKAAAEAGLAPHLWYASIEDQLSITDFVGAVPFPAKEALVRMPAVLRTLHALPPFAGVENHLNTSCMFLLNKGTALDGFIQRFESANIVPKSESEEVFARYAELSEVYARDNSDWVSSHNDLKPENILFDGHRVWLVDWEAAFLNDRYADLAVMANFVVANDEEEGVYLQEYFGQPPDEYQMARFFLMQQVVHMFYAMAYLLVGSSREPADLSERAPQFRDFHRRNWTGEVNLEGSPMKIAYGRAHWNELLQNIRQARFDEALKIVS